MHIIIFLMKVFTEKYFDPIKTIPKTRDTSRLRLNGHTLKNVLYSSRITPSAYRSTQIAQSKTMQDMYMANSIFSYSHSRLGSKFYTPLISIDCAVFSYFLLALLSEAYKYSLEDSSIINSVTVPFSRL